MIDVVGYDVVLIDKRKFLKFDVSSGLIILLNNLLLTFDIRRQFYLDGLGDLMTRLCLVGN